METKKQSSKVERSDNATTTAAPSLISRDSRVWWFLAAFLTFLISTYIAFTQELRPNPSKPVSRFSKEWWQYPVEKNGFKRLPVITSDLRDISVLPGTDNVLVAVGGKGLIVRSEDGGRSWEKAKININGPARAAKAINRDNETETSSTSVADIITDALIPDAKAGEAPKTSSKTQDDSISPDSPQMQDVLTPDVNIARQQSISKKEKQGKRKKEKEETGKNGKEGEETKTTEEEPPQKRKPGEITSPLEAVHFINSSIGWIENKDVPVITLILSFIYIFGNALRNFRAFGISPTKLLSIANKGSDKADLKKRLTFRHQFASEFSDVTESLKPRKLVVFIDDLDRCRSKNILEILESVNFLVSSGECFVILGLAPEIVMHNIALEFKEVAESMKGDGEDGSLDPVEYAKDYLEKMINIEVPVPDPEPEESERLVLSETGEGEKVPDLKERSISEHFSHTINTIKEKAKRHTPLLTVLSVMIASGYIGFSYNAPQVVEPLSKEQAVTQQTTGEETKENVETTAKTEKKEIRKEEKIRAGEVINNESKEVLWPSTYAPFIVLIIALIWIMLQRREVRIRDSGSFKDALKIWHGVITKRRNTPRSIKRYLNRTRYFAMSTRREEDEKEENLFKKLLNRSDGSKEKKTNTEKKEAYLVALSAIHHYKPKLLEKDSLFQLIDFGKLSKANGIDQTVISAIEEHNKKFQDAQWPPDDDQISLFKELSKGVKVH